MCCRNPTANAGFALGRARPITRPEPFSESLTVTIPVRILSVALAASLVAACGGGKERARADVAASRVAQIGVNAYLWRAALETLAFMPMAQTDSNGGVIVTDWYANPQAPNERVKVSVFILDQDLRADAIRVSAVRQENRGGTWLDAPVRAGTVQKLEETILAKARDLRRAAIEG
jgi:hypothetical protein